MQNWKVIHQSEIDDCHKEIKRLGLDPNDFNFFETETTKWIPGKLVPLEGTVKILRTSTKKEKTYTISNLSEWYNYFIDDLQKGYFD